MAFLPDAAPRVYPLRVAVAVILALALCALFVLAWLQHVHKRGARTDDDDGEDFFWYWIRGESFIYPAMPPSERLDSIDWNVMANVHEELLVLLATWGRAADTAGLAWWLGAGSVLGWVRNRSLIPWDDDIDIHISAKDLHLVQARIIPYLQRECEDFVMMWCYGWSLKLTRRSSPLLFLDFFVKVEDTGRWRTAEIKMLDGKLAPIWGKYFLTDNLTDDVLFPLRAVSLHGVPAFLPNDPEAVVKLSYGNDAVLSPRVFAAHDDGDLLARNDCVVLLS